MDLPWGEATDAPIAPEDLARFIVSVLRRPQTHVGKSYELHGSKEISQVQLAHAVSEALGVPVRYQPLPIEEYSLQLETMGFPELYVDFFVALAHDARDGIFSGWNDVYSQVTGNQPARRPGLHQVTPLSIRFLMNRNQQMLNTYKAVQITRPGILEIVARPLTDPGEGQVRIRVEACGICQSDSLAVEGLFPTTYPRVPGHEVVGKIDAIGRGVRNWRIGERVGVGYMGSYCGECESCRGGEFMTCTDQSSTGLSYDGGYAEVMIAHVIGLARIPDELRSAEAEPLLCAGVTTFNGLRNSVARPGDLVAVQGVGGVGHLGIQ